MGYNQDKDKLIKFWELETDEGKTLHFAIFSYSGGDPKLQMTRTFLKKDETVGYAKVGRLSLKEMEFINEKIDEFINSMKKV